ncbi:hypothetical protein B0H17DRAFT_1211013 [Mycena rosella]|uniref:Uncharacterized protein n=1 Tax=Mycena rosella TaxID=1033263 RepID=A0AAD7CVB6_MYCRO|nr:hypothetical protein B0H17DRAFT_1211013 [Mycena rosella]
MQHPRALLNASHPLCLVARNAADCRPIPAQTNSEFRTWHHRVPINGSHPLRLLIVARNAADCRPIPVQKNSDLRTWTLMQHPRALLNASHPFASSSSPATPLTVGQYLYKQILTFGLGDLSCSILGPPNTSHPFRLLVVATNAANCRPISAQTKSEFGTWLFIVAPTHVNPRRFLPVPSFPVPIQSPWLSPDWIHKLKAPIFASAAFSRCRASHVVQAEMPARSNFPPRAFLAAWARISDPWPFLTAYRFRMRPAEKMLCTRESDADNMTVVQAQLYWRYCMIQDAMQSEFGRASNCLHAVFGKGFAGAGIY